MYLWVKLTHLFFIIAWMVGLLYLPRLFVYHANAKINTHHYKVLVKMEKNLAIIIMGPSLMFTWITGIVLVSFIVMAEGFPSWLIIKILIIAILTFFHGYLEYHRKNFKKNINIKSAKFFKFLNEIPAVMLLIILFMVIIKPFS